MLVLGINDDHFEAGICLVQDGQVVFSANEERYTRRKNQGGFPQHTLEALWRYTGIQPQQIDRICWAGIMTPPLPKRLWPRLQHWLEQAARETDTAPTFSQRGLDFLLHHTPIAYTTPGSTGPKWVKTVLPPVMRTLLPFALQKKPVPIQVVEHHQAHAAAAYYLSGYAKALAITADGMGDGLALTISQCTPEGIERRFMVSARHSFGLFFEALTAAMGFIPCRHEGKLTGLAALGNADKVPVPALFHWNHQTLEYRGLRGHALRQWLQAELLSRYAREDVAAWAQQQLETGIIAIAQDWLTKTGYNHLVLAGGVFANVALNQRLHELPGVDHLFICPNMGDGGLSLGAIAACGYLNNQPITQVFWGEDYSIARMAKAISARGLKAVQPLSIHEHIAQALKQGKLVARYQGRMEWGPRALGHRSILAKTTDSTVVERLNHLLKRNDFMPFAPAALDEEAALYIQHPQGAEQAAAFMTLCFQGSELLKTQHPAVVHADGTSRLQRVTPANPDFYALLKAYKTLTGHGILLNTSFNIHEEPIVNTPEQAVDTFLRGKLDYLAMGPFWVEAP